MMWDSEVPKQEVLVLEVEKRKTGKLIVVHKQTIEREKFTVHVGTLGSESLHERMPWKAACSMVVLRWKGFPAFQAKKPLLFR